MKKGEFSKRRIAAMNRKSLLTVSTKIDVMASKWSPHDAGVVEALNDLKNSLWRCIAKMESIVGGDTPTDKISRMKQEIAYLKSSIRARERSMSVTKNTRSLTNEFPEVIRRKKHEK